MKVPFLSPTFPSPEDIAADYAAIVSNGIYSNGGPFDQKLSAALSSWIGEGVHVTTFANCTLALDLAIQALVNEPSDILVASFTFVAGPLAILRRGHRPVFIDVDVSTWQPSIDHARELLSARPQPGAILLTQTFGVANSDIAAWEALARAHDVPLILDSAAGFGSAYPWGEPLGRRGDCEVFSMHATKMLAAGEGGLLATRRGDLHERVGKLRNFGFDASRNAIEIGTNAKLAELPAAVALRQLDDLPERLALRREILRIYASVMPPSFGWQPGWQNSAPAFTSALLPDRASRDSVVRALGAHSMECRTYYNPPVHHQAVFADKSHLPNTDGLASRIIAFPMSDALDRRTIEQIAEATSRGLEAVAPPS